VADHSQKKTVHPGDVVAVEMLMHGDLDADPDRYRVALQCPVGQLVYDSKFAAPATSGRTLSEGPVMVIRPLSAPEQF
jgi:hypothetical protein